MQYISHYQSPLGNILLAADAIGLTGLWFEGQKYYALYLDKEHTEEELPILVRYRFILQDQTFKMKYGKFFALSPMGRQQPTVQLPNRLPGKEASPVCLHRQSGVQSVTTKYPLLFRVTGLWAVMAA